MHSSPCGCSDSTGGPPLAPEGVRGHFDAFYSCICLGDEEGFKDGGVGAVGWQPASRNWGCPRALNEAGTLWKFLIGLCGTAFTVKWS